MPVSLYVTTRSSSRFRIFPSLCLALEQGPEIGGFLQLDVAAGFRLAVLRPLPNCMRCLMSQDHLDRLVRVLDRCDAPGTSVSHSVSNLAPADQSRGNSRC